MEEKIKEKVREIQHKYCGEPVETKLYFAIKEERKRNIKIIKSHIQSTYPINCKSIIDELNSEYNPKTNSQQNKTGATNK